MPKHNKRDHSFPGSSEHIKKHYHVCFITCCLMLFTTFVGSMLFWVCYGLSLNGIDHTIGMIIDIDISSLEDCNDIHEKKDNHGIFYYNYTYLNNVYDGSYEICETNDGFKLHLNNHYIGSKVGVYYRPDEPSISSVDKDTITNKYCLGGGIISLVFICMFCLYHTCMFEEVANEMMAKEIVGAIGVGMNKVV